MFDINYHFSSGFLRRPPQNLPLPLKFTYVVVKILFCSVHWVCKILIIFEQILIYLALLFAQVSKVKSGCSNEKKKNNKEIFNTSVVFWVFKMPHRSSNHGHHSHGHSGSKKHALKVERVIRSSLFFCEYKVSSCCLIRQTHFKSFFQIEDKTRSAI